MYVAFNQDGPGCVGSFAKNSAPMLVNSTDDGLSWGKPYPPMLNVGPGKPPEPAGSGHGYTVGPTKGLTIKLPNGGGTRLMIPGENAWSASVFSDDHGQVRPCPLHTARCATATLPLATCWRPLAAGHCWLAVGLVRVFSPPDIDPVCVENDDQTWSSNAGNRSLSLSPGEMDWTPCVSGTQCPNDAKFVMINRAGGKVNPEAVGTQASDATLTGDRLALI